MNMLLKWTSRACSIKCMAELFWEGTESELRVEACSRLPLGHWRQNDRFSSETQKISEFFSLIYSQLLILLHLASLPVFNYTGTSQSSWKVIIMQHTGPSSKSEQQVCLWPQLGGRSSDWSVLLLGITGEHISQWTVTTSDTQQQDNHYRWNVRCTRYTHKQTPFDR